MIMTSDSINGKSYAECLMTSGDTWIDEIKEHYLKEHIKGI